jgi:Na+/proline symporter
MRIVVLTDVVQMLIIVVGIGICAATALELVGWSGAWGALAADRLRILDFSRWGGSAGGEYAVWPMAIGGMFLYASYYGCDQSQVQRELTVDSLRDVKKSLLLNAFGRFPVVLMYCLMGVLVGAVFTVPEHLATMANRLGTNVTSLSETLHADPDRMVPMFILAMLPAGVVGFVFVAIMSALMSSLDSAINSLSAVTMQDVYRVYVKPTATDRHYLVVSKLFTVFWGCFCIVAALSFAHAAEATRQTTIVLINAVGSLLYGPILAAFFVGMTTRSMAAIEIKTGVIIGIIANVFLWRLTDISWLWWNFIGFAVTLAIAFGVHLGSSVVGRRVTMDEFRAHIAVNQGFQPVYLGVLGYSFLIILIAYGIQRMG